MKFDLTYRWTDRQAYSKNYRNRMQYVRFRHVDSAIDNIMIYAYRLFLMLSWSPISYC